MNTSTSFPSINNVWKRDLEFLRLELIKKKEKICLKSVYFASNQNHFVEL